MTTSQFPLMLGCAFVAFSPFLAIFTLIVYKKAQLVIVATTAAFFFLLASTCASLVWKIFYTIGFVGPFAVIFPGVICQFLARCAFVSLYHKVESVIQISIQKQHDEEQRKNYQTNNGTNHVTDADADDQIGTDAGVVGAAVAHGSNNNWTDAARLRLELNDSISAIAAATGYGGMHAILLYGTLLAGQTSNVGVLYQESCPAIPSLVVSASFTFLFSVLDVFWMLFTFFGMRRRLLFHRGDTLIHEPYHGVGAYFGNSRNGGNIALLITLVTHLLSTLFTVVDYFPKGCAVSIPSVAAIVIITMYLFWAGCGRIYMPPPPSALASASSTTPANNIYRNHRRPSTSSSYNPHNTTTHDYHEC